MTEDQSVARKSFCPLNLSQKSESEAWGREGERTGNSWQSDYLSKSTGCLSKKIRTSVSKHFNLSLIQESRYTKYQESIIEYCSKVE